ncbi:MAG: sulfatase-like hydrolase/transferase [Syntrophaceae bacterium]|nr:sulfatase-like hydrolase/transferase [Syntrophaceae bacterium]
MRNKTSDSEILAPFLAVSFLFLLLNTSVYLSQIQHFGSISLLFSLAAYLSYSFFYFLPVVLILVSLKLILFRPIVESLFSKIHIHPKWLLYVLAVLLTWLLQVLIFADGFIFRLYSFHINGFVWNLVFTPGGVESMGGDTASYMTFAAITFGFLILQTLLMVVLLYFRSIRQYCLLAFSRRRLTFVIGILLILMALQSITYGVSNLYAYAPVLTTSDAFPFYMPLTFNRLARAMGIEPEKRTGFHVNAEALHIRYPLAPLKEETPQKKLNIVWLVAESLRADMLNPEIMPETWTFSEKAVRFENHYSGSNGTRQSLFSMFYGLYGNYWFSFLKERRGPVMMDVLLRDGYQMELFSSARFSYPEFNKTVFAQVPQERFHDLSELPPGQGWQHDRENVTKLLDFIDKREPDRPFMTFMFFESPHARYYFPPESAIRKPYLEDFNYATMNLKRDIGLIKNRYINSCHHLDSQYGRIIRYLERKGLLDSTIVILTGDHGEEFMEKGHWGHNSTFNEEQTRTPLVLWVPGASPRKVNRMTSHVDIPATLLPLLGVTSPAEDYGLGYDLLGPQRRRYTILGDWSTLAYVDEENKATFGYTGVSLNPRVTNEKDEAVDNPEVFYRTHRPALIQVMKELTRFSK